MNLVRAELRLHEKEQRFPLKATCLAIYSTAVNKQLSLDRVLAVRDAAHGAAERKRLY